VTIGWPAMHYTKAALRLFGVGMMLGFVVVVVFDDIPVLDRIASAMMAISIVLLPIALVADLPGAAFRALIAAGRKPAKRSAGRRTAKSPRPKPRPRAAARATRAKRS
jgi:hypothetical protein